MAEVVVYYGCVVRFSNDKQEFDKVLCLAISTMQVKWRILTYHLAYAIVQDQDVSECAGTCVMLHTEARRL
jgi:hypothetical protein